MPKVLTNATEMKLIRNTRKAHDTINKIYNLNEDDKVFLFVGRLFKLKNIFFIIDALAELEKLKPDYNYKMLYIGIGPDMDNLRRYIKEKHLDNKVILCGKVMDRELLASFYNRADLFLFPSLYDANSIVQIEAASQKTPAIFLRGAITASDIIDNETGFLSNDDPTAYAFKINEVINNQKLYHYVSNNVYKKIYKTWDDSTKEAFKIYLKWIMEYKK